MLTSIAIKETVKWMAFQLIDQGYTQCSESVECLVCGEKYLVLLDSGVYQRDPRLTQAAQQMALTYFAERLRESHNTGHPEDQFVML